MRKGYILLVTPTGKDELLTTSVLQKGGYDPVPCKNLDEMLKNYHEDAGALVIAVEALVGNSLERLRELVHSQPKWSDIPVIMILYDSTTTAEKIRKFFGKQGSINFLERPLSTFALLNAVEIALRSRHRQFEVRELLEQREAAAKLAENESIQKDHFLAMLAHELRNPLSSIRNCLQILTRLGDALDNKKRAGEIVTIQMEHITRLVDDLLDVARIRTGKFQLRPELIDLARILIVACESIQPMIRELEQHFHYEIPEEPIFINGDSVRIEEALLNLLNNASKYTSKGGEIGLIVSLEKDEVRIRIQDNGQGIEKGLQDSIFDPFVQANASQERRHEGLGLGLFLVREIVELHDGQIFLHSEGTNQGSEFEMRLPLATNHANWTNMDPFVETETIRYRILLIEDQALIAESMRMVLELSGSTIEWAGTGKDGIQAIMDGDFDAVLIDIGLPDMTGYEVAKRVREMQLDPAPLLIALTGYGQAEDKKRAIIAGFEAHYTKPVNEQDVFAFINSRLISRESLS